jgi:hypothetical protein
MSFKRHAEIYPTDRGADPKADAPAHRLDEFPVGYSLTGCSPALPASPTGIEYPSGLAPSQGIFNGKHEGKANGKNSRQRVHLKQEVPTTLACIE